MKVKRVLTLLMAALLMLSVLWIPANAAGEVTYPWTASDDFTSYSASKLNVFTYDPNQSYGTGFGGNWSDSPTGDGTVAADSAAAYKNLYTTSYPLDIGSSGGSIYRKLANPINFAETGKKYTFSFQLSSGAQNQNFRCLLGNENLYFGFQSGAYNNQTQWYSYFAPQLVVGSEVYCPDLSTTDYFNGDGEASKRRYNFELTIILKEGKDTLQVRYWLRNTTAPTTYAIEKEIELSGFDEMNYIGFYQKSKKNPIWNVTVKAEDISEDLAIMNRIKAAAPSFEAYRDLEAQGRDFAFYNECLAVFEEYGVAYESFDSYVSTTATLTDTGYKVSAIDGYDSSKGLNGGIGWGSSWQKAADGSTAMTDNANMFSVAYDNRTGRSSERTLRIGNLHSNPIKRSLKTPIDMSKDGEYYIWFVSRNANSGDYRNSHDLRFQLGENIYFGTIYNESDSNWTPLNLYVKGAEEEYQKSATARAKVSETYHYLLRIDASASDEDSFSLKMWLDGDPEPLNYDIESAVDSDEVINYIKFFNGISSAAFSKLCDVAIESYTGERLESLQEVEGMVADFSGKNPAVLLEAVNDIQRGIARDLLVKEINTRFPVAELNSGEFTTVDGEPASSVSGSLMFNYDISSTGSKDVIAYVAIYEDYILKAVLPKTISLVAGTNEGSFGFDGVTNVLPQASAGKTLVAKAFIWDKDLSPISAAIPLS